MFLLTAAKHHVFNWCDGRGGGVTTGDWTTAAAIHSAEPNVTVPPTPAAAPVPATKALPSKKAKCPSDSTDTALEFLAQYFEKKVPESKEKMSSTNDDDHIFGTFLAVEMKKIKSQKLKRDLKQKITSALFETQATDEQEQEQEQQQQMLQSLFVVDEQGNTQPLLQPFQMPATE